MEIQITSGSIRDIDTAAVIFSFFEQTETLEGELADVDSVLSGVVKQLVERGEIKGKLNEQTVIYTLGRIPAAKVAVLGLGKSEEVSAERIRGAVAEICRSLREKNSESAAIVLPEEFILSDGEAAQAITEGALLGTYAFRRHITKDDEQKELKRFLIVAPDSDRISGLEKGRDMGVITAGAAMLARDMVNEPSNFMTPSDMAAIAEKTAAETGLGVEILEQEQMRELGMGGLLGVSQGSRQPPRFIILKYTGRKSEETDIALVGKAITFDSGGISIKPSAGMEEMKDDMSGGAAVIAAMGAVARIKPPVNVVGLVPATENLPGGSALKPGDVIRAMGGKTIEIISTDAEGRLILADAIGYARKLGVKRIVDAATLTGAMVVALGDICSGAFTNNRELLEKVIEAGEKAGERIWQMPMYEEYRELNKSDVADIRNTGGRYAGSIAAAHFLGEFVDDVPWVHLDIAGTVFTEKTKKHLVKGATGVPVRTLINLVLSLAES